jgi:hypothetical protein
MASTTRPSTRPGEPTIEQLVADAKAGIFDDRLDASVPPELFGPPTDAERAAARRTNGRTAGAHAKGPNGRALRTRAPRGAADG